MFCSNCGAQGQDTAAFCPACGNRISAQSPNPNDTDRLVRRMARDVRFISQGRIPWKLVAIPFILMVLFGIVAFLAEIFSFGSGGPHR